MRYHQVADLFCGWLVLVLWFTGSWELDKVLNIAATGGDDQRDKKRPLNEHSKMLVSPRRVWQ